MFWNHDQEKKQQEQERIYSDGIQHTSFRHHATDLEQSKTVVNHRQIEIDAFDKILTKEKLRLSDITADGNCLYNAILQQLYVINHKEKDVCTMFMMYL